MFLYASACLVCAFLAFFLKPPCEDKSSEEEGRYILLKKDDFPVSGKSSFIDISMTETNNINSLQKPKQTNGPKEQDEENHEQITAAKKIISTLLEIVVTYFRRLSNPLLLMYLAYKCLVYFVIALPITFLPDQIRSFCNEKSNSPEFENYNVGYVLSILGICNFFSRLLAGYFCDFPKINALVSEDSHIYIEINPKNKKNIERICKRNNLRNFYFIKDLSGKHRFISIKN